MTDLPEASLRDIDPPGAVPVPIPVPIQGFGTGVSC
jgi:hypothetical protein